MLRRRAQLLKTPRANPLQQRCLQQPPAAREGGRMPKASSACTEELGARGGGRNLNERELTL